jgi:RecA-family ATPase
MPSLPELIGPGVLPKGHVMFLYGDEGTWKSWLVIELAFSMLMGFTWLMWNTARCRVLIINPEILAKQYQERLNSYIRRRGFLPSMIPEDSLFIVNDLDIRLDTPWGLAQLEDVLKAHPIDLLIIDGLYKVVSTDVVSGGEARKLIDGLDKIRQKYQLSLVIVHHSRQGIFDPAEGRAVSLGTSEMYGSSFYRDWADTILRVEKEGWHEDLITIKPQKTRHAEYPPVSGTFVVDRQHLKFRLAY